MPVGSLNLGEQFAIIAGQIEDAHWIAVEGQRSGLSKDEALVLVQQLQCQMRRIAKRCQRIAST